MMDDRSNAALIEKPVVRDVSKDKDVGRYGDTAQSTLQGR